LIKIFDDSESFLFSKSTIEPLSYGNILFILNFVSRAVRRKLIVNYSLRAANIQFLNLKLLKISEYNEYKL